MSNTIASLADLELELPLRPITDDLSAFTRSLSLSGSAEQGYAAFAAQTCAVGDVASRALGYAEEIMRFLALADTSSKSQVALFLDMLIALSLLNTASTIAVALAPPRSAADFATRQRVLVDVLAAIGDDAGFANLARKAFFHGGDDDASGGRHDLRAASVPGIEDTRDRIPAAVGLEQGMSLAAFLKDQAPAGTLIERAALQLDDADGFAREIESADLDQERLDRLQRAHQGACLLATADLARACLIAAVSSRNDHLGDRVADLSRRLGEARLRDIVAFAAQAADRLSELRRMQHEAAGRSKLL